ncbi:MAG TPA: glycosyltransferase family 2 protein [Candidatus Dormibacteraeota bacterium]|nr:glycosyltransferase family 2 protein [Candidatus Dormibacteraeota bacterium]
MTPVAPAVEISAVMPAYNEEANLEQSVGRMASALQAVARGFEIIVVDDGSQDGTAAVLERLKAVHPNLRVIRHAANRGYGAALRSGFEASRFGWIFLMDADNQFDPAEVELLLARAADADIVAGYRKHRRDPLLRRLNAWAFFTLVRLLFGKLVRDVNCAFRLTRRDLIARMALHSEGALINTEMLVLARQLDARVVEVPVHHYPRRAGKQTGANVRVVIRAFAELLAFRAEMKKVERAA